MLSTTREPSIKINLTQGGAVGITVPGATEGYPASLRYSTTRSSPGEQLSLGRQLYRDRLASGSIAS